MKLYLLWLITHHHQVVGLKKTRQIINIRGGGGDTDLSQLPDVEITVKEEADSIAFFRALKRASATITSPLVKLPESHSKYLKIPRSNLKEIAKRSMERIQYLRNYPKDIWNLFSTFQKEDESSTALQKLVNIIRTLLDSTISTLDTIIVSNNSPKMTFMAVSFLALAGSSLGFYSFLYFVTTGYASSILFIVVSALLATTLSSNTIRVLDKAPCFLVVMWAIRLIIFSLHREFINWPEWHYKMALVDQQITLKTKVLTWLIYSPLYAAMAMPCILRLQRAITGSVDKSLLGLLTGITLQALGLLLESVADYQKASFKVLKGNRKRWCNTGLYRFFLYPNYLGEGIFWAGTFTSSITCYKSFAEWAICIVGLTFILSILRQAMSSLDEKHSKKYGNDETYRKFRLFRSF